MSHQALSWLESAVPGTSIDITKAPRSSRHKTFAGSKSKYPKNVHYRAMPASVLRKYTDTNVACTIMYLTSIWTWQAGRIGPHFSVLPCRVNAPSPLIRKISRLCGREIFQGSSTVTSRTHLEVVLKGDMGY